MTTGRPRILQLCSDYAKQALYPKLLLSLAEQGWRQFMYVPVRTAAEIDRLRIEGCGEIEFRYVHLLRPHDRLLFRAKVRKVVHDVVTHVPLQDCLAVHAHFLYSDGAVALQLNRRFGLPFIVAVRNTDVNAFMRLRPDLAGIRNEVLRRAHRVVFLSPTYRDTFLDKLPQQVSEPLADKAVVVPNGLAPEWLVAPAGLERGAASPLRLLYVGDFTPNKNLGTVIAALRRLRSTLAATLTVVGGGGDRGGRMQRLLQQEQGVQWLGRVDDAERLRAIYREHDVFVMPSLHETFGLSYLEALSQGVPIVHSRGQGVDGYFEPGTVAEAVDPRRCESVADGVVALARRLSGLRASCAEQAQRFSWTTIARTYSDLYRSLLQSALP
jgi:glycosyltransferase involved in cell wall biosynthesis